MQDKIIQAIDSLILAAVIEGGVSDEKLPASRELTNLRKSELMEAISAPSLHQIQEPAPVLKQLIAEIDEHMRAELNAGRLPAESWPSRLASRVSAAAAAPMLVAQPQLHAALFAARGALQHMKEGGKPTQSLLNEAIAAIDSVAVTQAAPAAVAVPDEREAFEAKYKHLDLSRDRDAWMQEKYKHAAISLAWEAWQARAALAATPAEKSNSVEFDGIKTASPVVLPEPFALYDGEKWYANEEAAICSCADMAKLQKVFIESQLRALLAGVSAPAGDADTTTKEQYRRMFGAACEALGLINEALDLDPEDGGAEPILEAIAELKVKADARDAEQERWMGIGKAIERACVDLPVGAEIILSLEKDAGTVTLTDEEGDEQENFPTDGGLAGVVNAAIEAAIAAAKGGVMEKFLIAHIGHTTETCEHITWWKPDSRGYTVCIDKAGIYTTNEARSICRSSLCIAVPQNVAQKLARSTPYYRVGGGMLARLYDGGPHSVVENSREGWKALMAARIDCGKTDKPTPISRGKARAIYLDGAILEAIQAQRAAQAAQGGEQ